MRFRVLIGAMDLDVEEIGVGAGVRVRVRVRVRSRNQGSGLGSKLGSGVGYTHLVYVRCHYACSSVELSVARAYASIHVQVWSYL